MADLRPLGSEKLQGESKLQRILEIARWNEKTPNPVNEVSSSEYKITLADGNEYQIVKEKLGYIIKKTLNEGETDYIEPMQNRRYLNSYSQALKKLNLMAKEYNTIYENEEGTSLFSEQKKFVLRTPKSEKKNDVSEPMASPTPEPPAEPVPAEPAIPEMPSEPMDMDVPPMEDMSSEEPSMETETDVEVSDETTGDEEPKGEVSFKIIQKLVGKLGQKIRQYSEQNQISDKDAKYIINSVLSAIPLSEISDDTKEEIISKIEGFEGEEGGEEEVDTDVEVDVDTEEPMPDETEKSEMGEDDSEDIYMGKMGKMTDKDMIDAITSEIFSESKVDKILESYFKPSKNENTKLENEIIRLSESTKQKNVAKLFSKKNPGYKFVGKTNKKNLVFENKNKVVKISINGTIL